MNVEKHLILPHELGSSLLSSQSAFPSQYHDLGIHMRDVLHWNVLSESHWSGALDARIYFNIQFSLNLQEETKQVLLLYCRYNIK